MKKFAIIAALAATIPALTLPSAVSALDIGVGSKTGAGVNVGAAGINADVGANTNIDTGVNTGMQDNEGRDDTANVNTSSGSTFDAKERTTASTDTKINSNLNTNAKRRDVNRAANKNGGVIRDNRTPVSLRARSNTNAGIDTSAGSNNSVNGSVNSNTSTGLGINRN